MQTQKFPFLFAKLKIPTHEKSSSLFTSYVSNFFFFNFMILPQSHKLSMKCGGYDVRESLVRNKKAYKTHFFGGWF